jgi:hypothetical protein
MKLIIFISIIFGLTQSCGSKKEWTSFNLYDNNIQVSFPSKVLTVDTIYDNTEIGYLPTYRFNYKPEKYDLNLGYAFGLSPYPDTINIDEQALFDLQLEQVRISQNAILIRNRLDHSIVGCEGREYVFSLKNGSLNLYGRYIMCNNISITMTVLTHKDNFSNNRIYEFLNSLKVSDELKGNATTYHMSYEK